MQDIVACICEGSAEKAIIDLLLDNNKLCFERSDLIDYELISIRSADKFSSEYLTRNYEDRLVKIVRILDSTNENFKLKELYRNKISEISNHYTKPEIEMLIIINENHYESYTNHSGGMKPSIYCKKIFRYRNVKSYEFVKEYFKDIDRLLSVVKLYSHYSRKNGYKTIQDLIRISD